METFKKLMNKYSWIQLYLIYSFIFHSNNHAWQLFIYIYNIYNSNCIISIQDLWDNLNGKILISTRERINMSLSVKLDIIYVF